MNPKWLPDGSGIDPDSLPDDGIVVTDSRFWLTIDGWKSAGRPPVVRVYADVTPPKPDPQADVVARALHKEFCPVGDHDLALHEHEEQESWRKMAREILAALDAMGDEK